MSFLQGEWIRNGISVEVHYPLNISYLWVRETIMASSPWNRQITGEE